jgi:hypothetical protein
VLLLGDPMRRGVGSGIGACLLLLLLLIGGCRATELMPLRPGDTVFIESLKEESPSLEGKSVLIYPGIADWLAKETRDAFRVPNGTHAVIREEFPDDSARVMITEGRYTGKEGITLKVNLRRRQR